MNPLRPELVVCFYITAVTPRTYGSQVWRLEDTCANREYRSWYIGTDTRDGALKGQVHFNRNGVRSYFNLSQKMITTLTVAQKHPYKYPSAG